MSEEETHGRWGGGAIVLAPPNVSQHDAEVLSGCELTKRDELSKTDTGSGAIIYAEHEIGCLQK